MSETNNKQSSQVPLEHLISPVQCTKSVVEEENSQEETHAPINDEVLDPMPISQIMPDGTRLFCDNLHPRKFDGTEFGLPENWTVEYRPRTAQKYLGKVDQFFYEKGSGKQFRSVKAVEKFLNKELPTMRSHLKRVSSVIFKKTAKTRRLVENRDMPIHVNDDENQDNNGDNDGLSCGLGVTDVPSPENDNGDTGASFSNKC